MASLEPSLNGLTSSSYPSLAQLEAVERRSAASQGRLHLHDQEDLDTCALPSFVSSPRSLDNLVEGQNAHFEAKIEPLGDANLHVEWFKDGRPVTIGHRFRPLHDFGYVAMDIVGVISEDSGSYTVRATNSAGSAEKVVTLRCKSKSNGVFVMIFISISL